MRSFRTRGVFESLVLFAVWTVCGQCCATGASDAATLDGASAHVLFERGKQHLLAGEYLDACPLLQESHRLVPGIGVLMQVAYCFEMTDHLAAAWAAFQEAAERSRSDGDLDREAVARSSAERLYAKLSFVTLRVHSGDVEMRAPGKLPEGLHVSCDGKAITPAVLGIEIPIDPGPHNIVVTAKNMKETSVGVTLVPGEHREVEVPLIPEPQTEKLPPPVASSMPTVSVEMPKSNAAPPHRQAPSNHWNWIAWTTAGLGAAGLVVGATSGVLAYTQMESARTHCAGHDMDDCPIDAIRLQDSARVSADVSTAAFAAGLGCLVIAGGYWLVTKSGRTSIASWSSPNAGIISLSSRW